MNSTLATSPTSTTILDTTHSNALTSTNGYLIPNVTMTTDIFETGTTESTVVMTTAPTSTTTMATTTTVITTLLIACTKPPAVSNALFAFTGYDVIYTCNSGFTMSGSSRLDCDVTNGRWKGSPPSCSPLDLRPRVENTINVPETKEPVKSTDIQLIIAVIGGLLGLIALIGILLLITHICGCGTPLCGARPSNHDKDRRYHSGRSHRKISNGDVRIFHSNVEHTFYDSGNVLMDLESGRYVVPSHKEVIIQTDDHIPNGSVTNFHNFTSTETRSSSIDFQKRKGSIRSNSIDFNQKRKGSIDVRSSHEHEDSPHRNGKLYRAQRKVQAVNSWMPHSKPVRNINTSTK